MEKEEKKESLELATRLKTVVESVQANRPIIDEKVSRALSVTSLIKSVSDEVSDKAANDVLVKCNATLPVVEKLRKEYTGKLDDFKALEMEPEKKLKAEMERIRLLRNTWANLEAEKAREQREKIEKERQTGLEIARIKGAMVIAVETGILNRITQGEEAIAKLFAEITLDKIGELTAKLNFKPKLKEEVFKAFVDVSYDKDLVTPEQFAEIQAKALAHFDYQKCNDGYIKAVETVIKRWREKIPARKAELEDLAKAKAEGTGAVAEATLANKRKQEEIARKEAANSLLSSIADKAEEQQSEAILESEFKAQVAAYDVEDPSGRRSVRYRLSGEPSLLLKPIKIVDVMAKVMMHVMSDPSFKGFIKRHKNGYPVMNLKGEMEYIDAVQLWLDMLAKCRDTKGAFPDVPGLEMIEDVSTIARK